MSVLEQVFLGNTVFQWLMALVVAVAALVAARVLRSLTIRRLAAIAERTVTQVDDLVLDLVRSTKALILLALALYVGSLMLELPASARRLLNSAALIAFLIQATIWGQHLISFVITRATQRRLEEDPGSATMIAAMGFVARLMLYSLIVLVGLGTLGFDVTALVTGLGIGGIAVALAVQNILGDLFASVSIVLDRPFQLGDVIRVGQFIGVVEHIGLKTTRVRSLAGEQLVFSNSDLLGSRIQNYKRMEERRIVTDLGVVYGTPHDKLARIPAMIHEIVEAQEMARFDRAHFTSFGDYSLNFQYVYYVKTSDYVTYLNTQQAINLELYRRFAEEGIEFAFPTQTIYLAREAAEEAAARAAS